VIKTHNRHLIIIPDFRGIGGSQFYALRRIKHLESIGIRTVLIIGKDDYKISINENTTLVYRDQRIANYSFDYHKVIQNDVVKKIEEFLDSAQVTIIESTDPLSATWGELYAKRMKCKHVLYSLIEPPLYKGIQNKLLYSLIQFKQKQGNLIGLSSKSLFKMFGYENEIDLNRYVNISFDSNELIPIDEQGMSIQLDESCFVIGTISRLEKAYVQVLIEEVISLAKNMPMRKFCLLIIGDSIDASIKNKLESLFEANSTSLDNLQIKYFGYIHPIDASFFKNLDVFVGMGTTAVSSISQKCATIVVDPYLNLSSGLLGLDTKNFAYSENGKQYDISQSLKYLLENPEVIKIAQEKGFKLYQEDFTTNICMTKLDKFIEEGTNYSYWSYGKLSWIYFIRIIYQNRNRSFFKEINKVRHILRRNKLN